MGWRFRSDSFRTLSRLVGMYSNTKLKKSSLFYSEKGEAGMDKRWLCWMWVQRCLVTYLVVGVKVGL